MLSGLIGAGAQQGLEELLTRQLLEAQQAEQERRAKAQERQAAERLAFDRERAAADERARSEDIQQESVDRMKSFNAGMDERIARLDVERGKQDAAKDEEARLMQYLQELIGDPNTPEATKRSERARILGGSKAGPEDFYTDADRKREEDAAVRRAGRIARAQADARPPVAPKAAPAMTPGQKFSAVNSLRRAHLAETKAAREVGMQLQQMQSGIEAAKKGDMAAGSQAVLVTFQKILDPASVVRESEYARSSAGQALLSRIQGAAEQLQRGGAGVPLGELQKFVSLARQFAENQQRAALESKNQIGAIADEFGIDRNLVVGGDDEPSNRGGSGPRVVRGPDGKLIYQK